MLVSIEDDEVALLDAMAYTDARFSRVSEDAGLIELAVAASSTGEFVQVATFYSALDAAAVGVALGFRIEGPAVVGDTIFIDGYNIGLG